jgi:hypothetical protein
LLKYMLVCLVLLVLDEAAAADKEATDKRATEEAAAKRAVRESAAAVEEVAGKTMDEAAGAVAPSGSTPPVKRPYMGVWKPWFVHLSLPLFSFFSGASFPYYTFCPGPLPPVWPPQRARLFLP